VSEAEKVDSTAAGTAAAQGDAPAGKDVDPGGLRARREAAGMSIEEAASALRLAPRQVAALESGDWGSLPGMAFVRGALRSYGRLLGHDVESQLQQLQHPGSTQLRPAPSLGVTLPRNTVIGFGDGDFGHRWAWVALVVVGLVAVAMYFAGGRGLSGVSSWVSSTTTSESPAQGAEGTVIESVPIGGNSGDNSQSPSQESEPATDAVPAATTTPADVKPSPSSAAPMQPMGEAGPAPTANSAAAVVPTPTANPATGAVPELRLVFGRDSWVDIRDASGAQLLYGVQPADGQRALAGKPPFSLVIGNAAHVRLERSGRSVTLEPAPSSGIARLTVE
jgi:cytoskeleton protein RodZ